MTLYDLFNVKVTVSPIGIVILVSLVMLASANAYRKRRIKVKRTSKKQ